MKMFGHVKLAVVRASGHDCHLSSHPESRILSKYQSVRCAAQRSSQKRQKPRSEASKPRQDAVITPPAATSPASTTPGVSVDLDFDTVLAQEMLENGFRSTRRTKLICTIGPACCSDEMLAALASNGMNVARLNMSHETHAWHQDVIQRIRKLNKDQGFSVAIMMDTEGGSEVHVASVASPLPVHREDPITLTIRPAAACSANQISVSFGGFVEDVRPGDKVSVDGGMVTLEVVGASGPDVSCRVVDPGLILPRASITLRRGGQLVRTKTALLPVLSAKDWQDIDFAIENGVDFIGVSFVKTADVLENLRTYIQSRSPKAIAIVAKIESTESVPNCGAIIEKADAVMIARGDLGANIDLEDVPSVQREIVMRCRQRNKPVIVASQLLESMHTLPTPTRAEVADIADAVRQGSDALMLSGESAVGKYPDRALDVLRTVATRMEDWNRKEPHGAVALPKLADTPDGRVSEELCAAAAAIANNVHARAIFCFTKRGYMAAFLSRMRPEAPIFAFCDSQDTRQLLNLRWGVMPFRLDFDADPEVNIACTFALLKRRELIAPDDLVVVVSDIRQEGWGKSSGGGGGCISVADNGAGVVRSVQVRRVP